MTISPPAPIRVLLVDDHALFRSGVRALLAPHGEFEVVGDAVDGATGVACAVALRPDVILLDLNMPGLSGVETLTQILARLPDVAVLMLTLSEDAHDLALAMRAGACGYLIKSIETAVLVQAIRRAAAGEVVVAEAMSGKLLAYLQGEASVPPTRAALDALTPRERQILACLALGDSNKGIARKFDLAESTVKIHVQNVLRKLKLSNRVHAAVFAVGLRLDDAAACATEH